MKTILKMYKHLEWANKRILEYLQTIECDNESVIRLFSHILLAEQVWHARINGEDSSLLVWGDEDLATCAKLVKRNEERYSALLKDLSDADLERVIPYTNSQGKEYVNSIGDILTQVALHGQHHRGQINQLLRATGLKPVNIDFISMVR
ncbi:DinB family protein [Bacillus sp. EB600]|uniref:DinB family protein n=1 Tax=Bacillus sp. EB600 TaxID=2806345 RepID=UPI00210DFAFC|nr:DinB family protein [Bacillus sp. EB600]MCQ6280403.1 DinB family protein [Bacillus sp. EB600]